MIFSKQSIIATTITALFMSTNQLALSHNAGLRILACDNSPSGVSVDQVRFSLPKQLLHLTVNYDVYQKTDDHDVVVSNVLVVQPPVKMQLVTVPDKNLTFMADYSDVQGLVTDSKSNELTLTDNGCLKGINVEYDDQLAPILAETAAGMIKIGKSIATMAAAVPPHANKYKKLDKPITIDTTIDLDDAITTAELSQQPSVGVRNRLTGIIVKTPVTDAYFTSAPGNSFSNILPRRYAPTMSYNLKSIDDAIKDAAASNGFDPNLTVFPKLTLFLDHDPIKSAAGDAAKWLRATKCKPDKKGGYQVLLARAPETVEFLIVSDVQMNADLLNYNDNPFCDLDQINQFSQTGGFAAFEIRRHMLTNAGYKFSCNKAGAVVGASSTRTSTLKTLADAFKTITDAL